MGNRENQGRGHIPEALSRNGPLHLNPVHVADDLEGKVLLCWELPGQFCHRRLVAEWLEKNLLIEVPELDIPKAASPRSIQRELWSFL